MKDFYYSYQIKDGSFVSEVGTYQSEEDLFRTIAQGNVGQTVEMILWKEISPESKYWLGLLTGKSEIKQEDVEL